MEHRAANLQAWPLLNLTRASVDVDVRSLPVVEATADDDGVVLRKFQLVPWQTASRAAARRVVPGLRGATVIPGNSDSWLRFESMIRTLRCVCDTATMKVSMERCGWCS
jgi:hypothetical protein